MINVPEESSFKHLRITNSEEGLITPWFGIVKVKAYRKKFFMWDAAPYISIFPDGNHIAYIMNHSGNRDVFVRSTQSGSAATQKTHTGMVNGMNVSPAGNWIVFSDGNRIDDNIYMIDVNKGIAVRSLVKTYDRETQPYFSADGSTVFYVSIENGSSTIWSVNLETSMKTQYGPGFTPCALQDSNRYLITRNNKQTVKSEIWLVDFEAGKETIVLSSKTISFSSPNISPNGEWIACVGYTPTKKKSKNNKKTRPANLDIYLVKIDGTNLTQVTFHPGQDMSPVWDPDGKHIYFLSQRGSSKKQFNIWKVQIEIL